MQCEYQRIQEGKNVGEKAEEGKEKEYAETQNEKLICFRATEP